MKVLRVLSELKPSGVEVNLRVSAGEWAGRGIDLEILSTGPEVGSYAPALREAGYVIHHIPLEPFPAFVRRYVGLLRTGGYDLVHVHPERANLYTSSLARVATRGPVFRSIHNGFRYKGGLRIQRILQRALLRRMGVTFVSVSASVQDIEKRNFGNPTELVFNSFDSNRFVLPAPAERQQARSALGIEDHEFVIVTVGNCSTVKNHAALIKALGDLAEIDYRYLHVGLEDRERSERNLCERLGLTGRVVFMGQVDDPVPVLHAADCYVMPSLYEGFSNAALEALGCGLPSVLADVQGLRDLKPFFPTIWWVDPTPASVRQALHATWETDASDRDRLRREQAKLAHEAFRLDRAVAQYESLYRNRIRSRVHGARGRERAKDTA